MSRIQIEKIQFVGEQLGLNEYEAACTLAEDCELRAGLIVPRFDDYQTTTSAAQRACMVDVSNGTLRYKNSSGYVFAYGDDAYFLNADGQWTWVKPDGSELTLQEPNSPTISNVVELYEEEALNSSNGTWNVTPNPAWPPTWSNVSGSVTRTYTFSSSRNWQGAAYFWAAIEVPSGADPTFIFYVNYGQVRGRFVRADSTFGWLIWDVRSVDCSSVSSVGFSYYLANTHTLVFRYYLTVEYGVPLGEQVYAVTLERNGIESVLSTAVHKTLRRPFREIDSCGVFVQCSVSAGQAGDVVRLYRAVEGQYVQVASYTAAGTYTSVNLYDKGDVSEGYYRPSGKLPYGPAVVAGNRAVVAAGRTLWISQAGNPIRFGATAINEDNLDAYSVVLPAAIDAVVPAEGGVIAHSRRGQYFVPLTPQYENDLIHMRPPVLVDDRAASDHRAAAFGAFISDGRLFVDNQLVASGLSNDAWVLRTAGRVYVVYNDSSQGWCLVLSPQEWQGALRWKMPHQVNWVFVYGDDVFVSTSDGIYQVAGADHRKSSCRWRTGKRFAPALSALRFLHLAGDAYSVKLIRPGMSDVNMTNVSGRFNVPAQQQTHEWQLELNVAQSDVVYQCFVTIETGIQ
jgi:hypothetical protein